MHASVLRARAYVCVCLPAIDLYEFVVNVIAAKLQWRDKF